MTRTQFWQIVDELASASGGNKALYSMLCKEKCSAYSLQALIAFDDMYDEVLHDLMHWDLWGAAAVMMGDCSLTDFQTFLTNLIGRGSQCCELAQRDPDALVDFDLMPHDKVFTYHPLPLLLNIFIEEKNGGKEHSRKSRTKTTIAGEKWKYEDLPAKDPRLAERYQYISDIPIEDREALPDGAIANQSYSTNAPKVRMSVWHFLRHNSRFDGFPRFILILYAIGGVLCLLAWIKTAMIFIIPAVLLTVLIIRALYAMRLTFYHALLSPGVVINVMPLQIAVLTIMRNSSFATTEGEAIKILNVRSLPRHHKRVGERVPMVCSFDNEPKADIPAGYWTNFETMPIAWATSSVSELQRCMDKIGNQPFELLESYVRQRRLPPEPNQLLFLDLPGKVPPPLHPMF